MSVLTDLLDLQHRDTALDQLRHRRATLPERAALAALRGSLADVERALAAVEARRAELTRTQKRIEDEVAGVEAKRVANERKMGATGNVRELQGMQAEQDALERRRSDLETEVLEVMEAADPVDEERGVLAARRDALDAQAATAIASLTEAEVAIDTELAAVQAARAELAARLPGPVLAQYEQLRPKLGGVAVAALEGNRCTGCHLVIPAVELEALRHLPPDEVARHEECGRILVRL